MSVINDYAIKELLIPATVMLFLVGSLICAAIGAGLIVSGARMFRLFAMMNRYVSTRHGFKPLAVPHDVGRSVHRHTRLIGALFVVGAAFSIYGQLAWFDKSAAVALLNLGYPRPFVAWILESLHLILIALNAFALVVGVLLVFVPRFMDKFEKQADRWVSVRHMTVGVDTMHLTLDRLVAAYPRAAGSIIVVASVYVAANAAILWLRFH
jgi:hypothetical protein